MFRIVAALAAFTVITVQAYSSIDTIRVCGYNVLNFSESNVDGRIPAYVLIMDAIRPDVLVCTEVVDASMGSQFVTDVLTWAPFAATPFIDGEDTDCQLFYDQLKFDFISQRRITTALRDVAEFILLTKRNDGLPEDTVVFYGLHLKASDGTENENARAAEVNELIVNLPNTPYLILTGDLNIYSTNEAAYKRLCIPMAMRGFVDPLGNSWSRNNTTWAHIYTQCTRLTTAGACGGGVDGGMDDRFDYILFSTDLAPRYVANSCTAFGNDGAIRFNKSINNPTNTIVSSAIADALFCASDHLPVYADVVLGDIQASVNESETLSFKHFNGKWIMENVFPNSNVQIFNMNGLLVATAVAESSTLEIDAASLVNGFYFARIVSPGNISPGFISLGLCR